MKNLIYLQIMTISEAKQALDKIISKGRVHLYKPIQIAEILYRDRMHGDIDLADLDTYRNPSKKWRDAVCVRFLGRTSTSSARYQDDVFNENAVRNIFTTVSSSVFHKCQADWIIVADMIKAISRFWNSSDSFGTSRD